MRAENWNKQEFELEGWTVKLTSYQIGQTQVAEVEAVASGAVIARSTDQLREQAEKTALENARKRLLRTRRTDFDLTVGG
ncbi:MAG: hypothetical protein JWP08_124 [Bryobacterales bacterium]|jgi:hypothetical protein|nr:hypothetical protein [Bryobacterales bacterium]